MPSFLYKFTVFVVGIVRAIREKRLQWELKYNHRKRVRSYGTEQVLTKEQEKQIQEYYAPYKKVTTEFHNFYTKITGQFHANYLPDDLYYSYIDTYYNDWRECSHIDNKCFYPRMFINIRQAENIACRIRGLWFTGDCRQISREELDAIMAKEPEVVVKMATDSEGGKGVFFVKGTEVNSVLPRIRDDIVIQRPLKQHEALAAINASSINTIRMISLISEEGVKIYSSILRMGISGARVDNASSGGITCGITEDGKLKKYAHKVNGQRFDKHPDSGLAFEGYEVPGYQKCLDAVPMLHAQMPRFRLVSWDFAIDPDGEPVLIEANLHYGELDFHQINNGPIFGEDTEKILKEVFNKR
jgi:hypothetical protein